MSEINETDNMKGLAQPEAWKNIKARLSVVLTANETVVAETDDPVIWAKILRFIGDNTHD